MRGTKRGRLAAAVAVTGLAVSSLALSASATIPGSTFEGGDGNVISDGAIDWVNIASNPNIQLEVGADLPTGSSDNSFGQGSKENNVNVHVGLGSIPNSKADIGRFAVASETVANGDVMMYLAWTRNNDSGTTNFDFEINQLAQPDMTVEGDVTLNRSVGDLLITYDFQGGAQKPTLAVRLWTGTAWGASTPLGNTVSEAEVNRAGPVSIVPFGGTGTVPAFRFGEAAINLTDAGILPDQSDPDAPCVGFGSAFVKSRSSNAFTAELKDFIAPIPVHINNCGTIIIEKVTDPDPDETNTQFDFTLTGGPSSLSESFDLLNGESETFTDVKAGDGYVAEEIVPTGWDLTSATCDDGSPVTNIDVSVGEVVTCTFTNTGRATLTILKLAERPNVDFSFTADAPLTPATFELADTESRDFTNLAAGTYGVAEDGEDGWNLVSATCDNGDTPDAVELNPGDHVTCTFINEVERGAVLIHKTAKHAASPTGVIDHAGVTFTVANATNGTNLQAVTDANGLACVDNVPVSLLDGNYTVTETVPAGYVSADAEQSYTVVESDCDSALALEFVNTPLTNVTVSVDSIIPGGTASVIDCGDGPVNTDAVTGDGSVTLPNLEPTAPSVTVTCTITIDP